MIKEQRPETLRFKAVYLELRRQGKIKGYADFAEKTVIGSPQNVANLFKTNNRNNATATIINSLLKTFPEVNPDYIWKGQGEMFIAASAAPDVAKQGKARFIQLVRIPELLRALGGVLPADVKEAWTEATKNDPLVDVPIILPFGVWPSTDLIAMPVGDDSMFPPLHVGSVSYFRAVLYGWHQMRINFIPAEENRTPWLLITKAGFYFGFVSRDVGKYIIRVRFANDKYSPVELAEIDLVAAFVWVGSSISEFKS